MSAAGIGAATSIIGGLISAYGQYQQGQMDRRVAELNARQLDSENARIGLEAQETKRRRRRLNERILGSQKAAIAKSGVAMGTGSPLIALAENAALLEMDVLDEQRSIEIDRRRRHFQARLSVAQGKAASRAANTAALATVISSVGSGTAQAYQGRTPSRKSGRPASVGSGTAQAYQG